MATSLFASPLYYPRFRAWNAAGTAVLSGGKVYVYLAGTTTATDSFPTYSDALLGTNANANPVVLDANGEANIFLPVLASGTGLYKIVVQDASSVQQWSLDNINPALTYQAGSSGSEWIADTHISTYVSATSFTLGFDQTAVYTAGRRIRVAQVASGPYVYATVVSSSFSSSTTVTVVCDSGTSLNATMSQVYYGATSYANPSYLDPRTRLVVTKTSDMTGSFSGALKVTGWTTELDTLTEWGSDKFTARYPGYYSISMTPNITDTAASQGFFCYFAKNGSGTTPRFAGATFSTGGTAVGPTFTRLMSLSAGDTVEMQILCTNNTTIKATHTVISIHRVV